LRQKLPFLKSIGICILLFVAVYLPTFFLANALHLPKKSIVPFVILTSLSIALLIESILKKKFALTYFTFGFSYPDKRIFIQALFITLPIALLITWGLTFAHQKNPLGDITFSTFELFFYFGIGAAFQEEIIFRGLLQTVLNRQLGERYKIFGTVVTAFLFAIVHLEVGLLTALSALTLGLIAGYYRNTSKNIWTPILVHCIFNLSSLIWITK
jgi:membrane protease YdiL (CAAX protease family)